MTSHSDQTDTCEIILADLAAWLVMLFFLLALKDLAIGRFSDWTIWRFGDLAIGRLDDLEKFGDRGVR